MPALKKLVMKNRSYRRFNEEYEIKKELLTEFIDIARHCPSAANLQPIKYIISNEKDMNEKIFSTLAWAGYLKDWQGPIEGERPSAYIIMLADKNINTSYVKYDLGINAQTILLAATEKNLGGCMIAGIRREDLKEQLNVGNDYDVLLVIALGKPKEEIIIEYIDPDANILYYRDPDGKHHVPKRKLDQIIIEKT